MDIRITNACNNDCIYCLEQQLRKEAPFIDKDEILKKLKNQEEDTVLNFYGGNPLLHPDLRDIISSAKEDGFRHISLLTNTDGLSENYLEMLMEAGLDGIGFYFNSFDSDKHDKVTNGGISLHLLKRNLDILAKSGIYLKCIIHINKQNIETIYKDILLLQKDYRIKDFEFINFFPFDRPYDVYSKEIFYDFDTYRPYIKRLFKALEIIDVKTSFKKFGHDFFKDAGHPSDVSQNGNQIGIEDVKRMNMDNPFCLSEKRCKLCFIKDFCKHYK